jgi:hypothetical protein
VIDCFIQENLPAELRIWIDPDEVSYQIGEKGTVSILYAKKGAQVEYGADIAVAAQRQVKIAKWSYHSFELIPKARRC